MSFPSSVYPMWCFVASLKRSIQLTHHVLELQGLFDVFVDKIFKYEGKKDVCLHKKNKEDISSLAFVFYLNLKSIYGASEFKI